MFTQIPVIALPCNAEYCTGQHTVDRSLVSLSRYRQKRERSWRPCLSACPFGQDREFPRHSTYSVVKDHGGLFLSPHFYWQGKRHFLNQNEKIFFFLFAGGLCPHFYWQKKSAFLQPKQKKQFYYFALRCFMCSRLLWLFLRCRIFSAPGLNTFPLCIRAACQVPRSIYAATSFATTRIICALTDIKCSSPKDLSPPTGRPYHVRKYHYSHSPCLGLPHDAVNRAVRHRMNRSLVFLPLFICREKEGHGAPARQLVLSDGAESNLGTPNIQLLRIAGELFLSPHCYWQKNCRFYNQTEKIFFWLPMDAGLFVPSPCIPHFF